MAEKKEKWIGWTIIGSIGIMVLSAIAPYWLTATYLKSPLIGALAGAITLPVVSFLIVYFVLAPKNLWWTFTKEATAKFVVRADQFEKAIMRWEGHDFDRKKKGIEKWNVIEVEPEKEKKRRFGGLEYYGPWPLFDILIYKFTWISIGEKEEIKPKSEWIDYILLRDDVYWAKVDRCEDANLFPLELELLLTIRIINPYKAIFNIQKWLEAVINRIKPFIRQYITGDEYEQWIKKKQKLGIGLRNFCNNDLQDDEGNPILDEKGQPIKAVLPEFRELYGVDLRKIEVKAINPPEGYREKTIAPYLAELAKKKTIIDADAESQRIKKVFGTIESFGELGKLIRTLEAVEKSPLAASLTVQAVPGLQEAFRGVFGRQPPEEMGKEDLKALIKELKELREEIKKAKGP